jgi:ABC-2 type transport system ATP-binding protein
VHSGALTIEVQAAATEVKDQLSKIGLISTVTCKETGDGWVHAECLAKPGEDVREQVDQVIKKEAWPLREFRRGRATLEDVFVELTQD